MKAKAVMPKKSSSGTQLTMKIYFTSLPFHPQCLNFRANMGSSATSNHDDTHTPTNKATAPQGVLSIHLPAPTMSEPQNRALAGVGSPMNEVVCRSSRLNLARRSAENAAITKAR